MLKYDFSVHVIVMHIVGSISSLLEVCQVRKSASAPNYLQDRKQMKDMGKARIQAKW